jgi:hypothetical protein
MTETDRLRPLGEWFIDGEGRCVLLRGVNLAGNCKFPALPLQPTHVKTDFHDHRTVSFVGHPFPLADVSGHFERLRLWGFNALRFLVSWEAVEHAGPGIYDEEYLDYVERILALAADYGFWIIVDPHQDVWSRMSGGDGAPGWTFEAVGIDFMKFHEAAAALVMQNDYDPADPRSYPPMHWPGNSMRFACGTMFSLFFGGRDFAPSCEVEGVNAEDYLQLRFLETMKQVAGRVRSNPRVLGFDIPNEPQPGWIGILLDGSNNPSAPEALGYAFTPFDAMAAGSGFPRQLGFREIRRFGIRETRRDALNPNRVSCWLPGHPDIWRREGVWGIDGKGKPVMLHNDHFCIKEGKQVDFWRDYLSPFIVKYAAEIRSVMPDALIFLEASPERALKGQPSGIVIPDDLRDVAFAPHWYDAATLGTKKPMTTASFDMGSGVPVVGKAAVARMFVRQLSAVKGASAAIRAGIPTILAEFGLPFDMNGREAFGAWEREGERAWDKHVECLSLYYDAVDANLLHSLQWNYTPDNTNEHGDGWNLEDLSIYSMSQRRGDGRIDDGGRAVRGFCRPRFIHCAGVPFEMSFDHESAAFTLRFMCDQSISAPTVIYVPKVQYPDGYEIDAFDADIERRDDNQLVLIRFRHGGEKRISITRR